MTAAEAYCLFTLYLTNERKTRMDKSNMFAVDVTQSAVTAWGARAPEHLALSSGLVGYLQRDEPELRREVVVPALLEIHPDRWQATPVPYVYAVRTAKGVTIVAWEADGGTVIGFPAEVGIALSQNASVVVLVPDERVPRMFQ